MSSTTSMQLTVLGCDGSWPSPGGATSSYLLRSSEATIWLDAGNGSFALLQGHLALSEIDAIVLSHRHADHCADIVPFFVYAKHGPGLPSRIPVLAAPGVREEVFSQEPDLESVFEWKTLADGHRDSVADVDLHFSRTDHGPPTFGMLARCDDKTFAYSADTGPNWSFKAFDSRIDLALCAASLTTEQEGGSSGHMSARQAGALSATAGVERLVLTHLRPTVDRDQARRDASLAFGRDVTIGEPAATYDI